MTPQKQRISVLSLILAFSIQAVTVAWFLSDLNNRVKDKACREVEHRLDWTVDHLNDLEQRLRILENRRP